MDDEQLVVAVATTGKESGQRLTVAVNTDDKADFRHRMVMSRGFRLGFPFNHARSRPMSERSHIQFRSLNFMPDVQHIPHSDIIKDHHRRLTELDGFEIL